MTPRQDCPRTGNIARALNADDSSVRLQAAMAAGSRPDERLATVLVDRCGAEPDFFVRDMLTWALAQLPPEVVLPLLHNELSSSQSQARSQALHTLSKIADPTTWPWITDDMLRDPDERSSLPSRGLR